MSSSDIHPRVEDYIVTLYLQSIMNIGTDILNSNQALCSSHECCWKVFPVSTYLSSSRFCSLFDANSVIRPEYRLKNRCNVREVDYKYHSPPYCSLYCQTVLDFWLDFLRRVLYVLQVLPNSLGLPRGLFTFPPNIFLYIKIRTRGFHIGLHVCLHRAQHVLSVLTLTTTSPS